MQTPYVRKAIVEISSVPEWSGGIYAKKNYIIESKGDCKTLRVSFLVQKDISGTPNQAIITLYNLNKNTQKSLNNLGLGITLKVGWDNVEPTEIFCGGIVSVSYKREGADIATILHCINGFGVLRGVGSWSFGKGQDLREAVYEIAKTLEGISVNMNDINVDGKIGASGYAYAGASRHLLNQWANTYGFSHSVQDNQFIAISDDKYYGDSIDINENYTIMAEPVFSSPLQTRIGITLTSVLQPKLRVGGMVNVSSVIDESLAGKYKVHHLEFRGDTYSSTWVSILRSVTISEKQKISTKISDNILTFTGNQ